MQTLREMVRSITIIILIGGFLELLLPSGQMKRFVKMVIGLFILISMLNPIMTLFRQGTDAPAMAWDLSAGSEAGSIIAKSEAASQGMKEKTRQMYGENVGQQMEAMVKILNGVESVKARVEMETAGSGNDFAKVRSVTMTISSSPKNGGKLVAPVEVDVGKGKTASAEPKEQELKEQAKEVLKNFFNLQDEQIHVVIDKE